VLSVMRCRFRTRPVHGPSVERTEALARKAVERGACGASATDASAGTDSRSAGSSSESSRKLPSAAPTSSMRLPTDTTRRLDVFDTGTRETTRRPPRTTPLARRASKAVARQAPATTKSETTMRTASAMSAALPRGEHFGDPDAEVVADDDHVAPGHELAVDDDVDRSTERPVELDDAPLGEREQVLELHHSPPELHRHVQRDVGEHPEVRWGSRPPSRPEVGEGGGRHRLGRPWGAGVLRVQVVRD